MLMLAMLPRLSTGTFTVYTLMSGKELDGHRGIFRSRLESGLDKVFYSAYVISVSSRHFLSIPKAIVMIGDVNKQKVSL